MSSPNPRKPPSASPPPGPLPAHRQGAPHPPTMDGGASRGHRTGEVHAPQPPPKRPDAAGCWVCWLSWGAPCSGEIITNTSSCTAFESSWTTISAGGGRRPSPRRGRSSPPGEPCPHYSLCLCACLLPTSDFQGLVPSTSSPPSLPHEDSDTAQRARLPPRPRPRFLAGRLLL